MNINNNQQTLIKSNYSSNKKQSILNDLTNFSPDSSILESLDHQPDDIINENNAGSQYRSISPPTENLKNYSQIQVQNTSNFQRSNGFTNKYLQSNFSKDRSLSDDKVNPIKLSPIAMEFNEETAKEFQKYKHQIDECNKVIDVLRRELNHTTKQVNTMQDQHIMEKDKLKEEYEKKIEDTRRDTREKVQKVYEKRIKSNKDTNSQENPKHNFRSGNLPKDGSQTFRETSKFKNEITNHSRRKTYQIENIKKPLNSSRQNDTLEGSLNINEMTFEFQQHQLTAESLKQKESEIREQMKLEYEEILQERTFQIKIELQKKIREELDQELRTQYLAQAKYQREVLRKEIQQQLQQDYENKLEKELEKRLSDNFLEWEEEYKRQKIQKMKETVNEELRSEYEYKLQELLEKERIQMQEQAQQTINENIKIARDETERTMQEQILLMQDEMERQIKNEKMIIKAECLEEMRSDRELEMQKKLREKLTKQIQQELIQQLPKEIEGKVRQEITEKLVSQIKINNQRELDQLKRKFELQKEEKESAVIAQLRRDFDFQVRSQAEEMTQKKEKEIIRKYKIIYEKEKRDLEQQLKKEFETKIKEFKDQLDKEKSEISRLKSLELIRLKKVQEQKRELAEQVKLEKIDLERKKVALEFEARERKVKELEFEERKRDKTPRQVQQTVKLLEKDEGAEMLCKNYHVSIQKSSNQPKYYEQAQETQQEGQLKHDRQKSISQDKQNKISSIQQLYPVFISKESTFNPNQSQYQEIKTEENQIMITQNSGQQTERQSISEMEVKGKEYIKPYDSRSLVKQLLKDSVQKFQLQSKLRPNSKIFTPQYSSFGKENEDPSEKVSYDQLLRQMESKQSSTFSSNYSTLGYQSQLPVFEKSISALEYKMIFEAHMNKELQAEKELNQKKNILIQSLESILVQKGMSDHGMIEYLFDLWEQVMISYQYRLQFLFALLNKDAKGIYSSIENETCKLANFKNEASHIYQLIKKKENKFGNLLSQKYLEIEHSSDLFAMRTEIIKKIEEYKRKHKKSNILNNNQYTDILWKGVPYIDICKMEKWSVENKLKEDIREEIEIKRMNRATGISKYNNIIN